MVTAWDKAVLAAAMAASACLAGAEVPPVTVVAVNKPVDVAPAKTGQRIAVKSFYVKPTGEKIGVEQTGLFCSGGTDVRFSQNLAKRVLENAGLILRRELDAAGYPKVQESAFETSQPNSSVEYEIAATLVDLQVNVCGGVDAWLGGVWMKLDWELFSPRERRVVYRAEHEGSYQDTSKRVPFRDMHQMALTAAVKNLLADPRFVAQATQRATGTAAEVQTSLSVAVRHAGGANAQARMPILQSSVVTIFSGAGSGSGFYIHADGYVLTNHHVVGDAKFVKIKLANGRELLGEVLRTVALRDVALVKTEAVALAPMELAVSEPKVGEEVYALGSPFGDTFASTVTRGVLSSIREIDQLRWLQSDVRVLPGSSGGPLVAADGAVVAIAARGAAGMNLFVPIAEAMGALKIEFAKP